MMGIMSKHYFSVKTISWLDVALSTAEALNCSSHDQIHLTPKLNLNIRAHEDFEVWKSGYHVIDTPSRGN